MPDPFGTLIKNAESSAKYPFNFKTDIDPWLGSMVAFFITTFGKQGASGSMLNGVLGGKVSTSSFGNGVNGALVIDTTDADKAQDFLNKDAQHSGAHKASYRDVDYMVTSDGTAEGIVDGFAVIGSQDGFRAVVDTEKGKPPLSDAVAFTRLHSAEPATTLANVWVNLDGILSSVQATESGASVQDLALVRMLLGAIGLHSFDVALGVPSNHSLALDVIAPSSASSTKAAGSSPSGSQVLEELPGDSWLALGVSHFGTDANQALSVLGTLANVGGANLQQSLSALSAAGFDVQKDLFSWMGGAGLFVRGTTPSTLQAGIVIDSTDPAASRNAVLKLGQLLQAAGLQVSSPSLPDTDAAFQVQAGSFPLVVASGESKFVIGLGDASVASSLGPRGTLASSQQYATAKAALGTDVSPSLLLNFQTLATVLDGLGVSNSATISSAMPTLEKLGLLVAGGHTEGATVQDRVVLDLNAK